jgi:hypothetical protein
MTKSAVNRKVLFKNADNLAVWVTVDKTSDSGGSHAEKLGLINAEIQAVCNDHVSTLDDSLHKKSPRPNPTPRVFIEQGNELSQILWLRWES